MTPDTDCFECGATAEHEHHVVPRSKEGMATVPLCVDCHADTVRRISNKGEPDG